MMIRFKVCGLLARPLPLCLFLLLALSCAPEGELQRTIHPPTKRPAEAIAKPSSSNLLATTVTPSLFRKGLPEACRQIENTEKICLECQTQELSVYRCFNETSDLDPKTDCQHSTDHIKCLAKNPPEALSLDWRTSDEKFLRENYSVWKQAVHEIWAEKIAPTDRDEFSRILRGLDLLTTALTTQKTPTAQDEENLVKALGLAKDSDKLAAHGLLNSLRKERAEGRMTLSQMLKSVDTFYTTAHGASPLWEDLRTMSLEGLEE